MYAPILGYEWSQKQPNRIYGGYLNVDPADVALASKAKRPMRTFAPYALQHMPRQTLHPVTS